MTGRQARLDGSRRVVRCCACGTELGRIWDDGVGGRHFLFRNSMGLDKSGRWKETKRGRRAGRFGHQPYRRPLPVADALTPGGNPFAAVALEPTTYPLRVACPRCPQEQEIDATAIGVQVPEAGEARLAFMTWPLSEPYERIGQPDEE